MNRNIINNINIKKIIIIIMCSASIGVLVSYVLEFSNHMKARNDSGIFSISDSQISFSNEIVKENNGYKISEKGGKVTLEFSDSVYINRLQYKYITEEAQEEECKINIYTKNVFNKPIVKQVDDNYRVDAPRSVVNIKENVSKIDFEYPQLNAELIVFDFAVDNTFKWNPLLAFVISIFSFVLLYLIVFRRENAEHIERASFVCILLLSTCMLVVQPPYCSSWDEEIHFARSYNSALTGKDNSAPNAAAFLIDNYAWFDFHHDNSMEERVDLIRAVNSLGEINGGELNVFDIEYNIVGYVFQAMAITIGKFLNLPFYFVWLLGKFTNLLLYAIGMSIAIRIVPIGKRILAVIALLPTMIFLNTSYTYDITVIVFVTISICIGIKEIVCKEQIFAFKWRVAYIVCMFIGCMPKAVYAPLLFSIFMLPINKFYSKSDRNKFRGAIIVVFLLIMSTYILPALFSPAATGDIRGGDTSVSRQLILVLQNPISYAWVLVNNVKDTFVEYTFGRMVTNLAYWGGGKDSILYALLLLGTILTDTYEETAVRVKFSTKDKVISLVSILGTIVLVWTALYLSFTEIGNTKIAGVQGRYYLPFIFLIYLCIRTKKIKCDFKIENYQMFVMIIASIMLMFQISKAFLLTIC